LIAVPTTIWSARRWMEKKAWMVASRPPKTIAIRIPTTHDPLHAEAQMPKKAPDSIMPSRPMLITPARSLKIPPIAANASGVAKRRVAASSPTEKIESRDDSSRV
jgi:hypothetical protein